MVFWPDELKPKIARRRELTRQAGRPEEAVKVCLAGFLTFDECPGPDRLPLKGHPEQIADDMRQYQAIGINDFILYLARSTVGPGVARNDPTTVMETMERFVREVIPLVHPS